MDEKKQINDQNGYTNSEKIKLAAMKLFSMYGYGSTTVRMIAKEAGLSAGQITVHYGSKEELYESIVQDAVDISWRAITPIKEKREQYIREGTLTREHSWALIRQLICDLVDYCLIPYNRACIMMVNIALPNSQIVENAKRSMQNAIVLEHEMFLAQLLEEYAEKKGYLKYRVISRAVNGAIVSFAEHEEFLMSEVYANEDPETALNYAKGHLKNLLLNTLKDVDRIEDYTNVEKY